MVNDELIEQFLRAMTLQSTAARRSMVGKALEAVAPAIRAQALEDAAVIVDEAANAWRECREAAAAIRSAKETS